MSLQVKNHDSKSNPRYLVDLALLPKLSRAVRVQLDI